MKYIRKLLAGVVRWWKEEAFAENPWDYDSRMQRAVDAAAEIDRQQRHARFEEAFIEWCERQKTADLAEEFREHRKISE